MADQENIVILGASSAGIQVAHYILKHIIPKLSNPKLHVYVVSPSSDFYFMVASPRAILNDALIPENKQFLDIPEAFKPYPNATVVVGKATSLDTAARTVDITLTADGKVQTIPYYSLVISTGASSPSALWGPSPTTAETKLALHRVREVIPTAKTIVIAGGGPVGVESAGEIGEYLNGPPGWSSPSPKKVRVCLITSSQKLLPVLSESAAKQAEKYLTRLGVEVIYGARVETVSGGEVIDGVQTDVEVTLSTGTKIQADLYLPATGLTPNTSFLPKDLVTASGHVKTNPETLRVDDAGSRVYSVGDVSSASPGGFMHILSMVPVVVTNIHRDLIAAAAGTEKSIGGKDKPFVLDTRATQVVPVGRSKGVGQIMGWWFPSFFVWLLKGRDFMISGAPKYVYGDSVAKPTAWKFLE